MKATAENTTRNFPPAGILQTMTALAAATIALSAAFIFGQIKAVAAPHNHTKAPAGDGIVLNLVEIDITGGMEIISAGYNNYTSRANFETLSRNAGSTAAINGCFFDLRSGRLVGHVYRDGRQEVKGTFGAAFAVGNDGKPVIDHIKKLGDPADYKVIISCVDILMKNGKILVSSKADLVRNGHKPSKHNDIYKAARWSAIGIGKSGKVYLIATANRISMYRFIKEVAEHTEIVDMLGLDGGTSTGLYYDGKVLIRPQRTVASIIAARPAAPKPIAVACR